MEAVEREGLQPVVVLEGGASAQGSYGGRGYSSGVARWSGNETSEGPGHMTLNFRLLSLMLKGEGLLIQEVWKY